VSFLSRIIIEKHYRRVVSRSVVDQLFDEMTRAGKWEDVPPVLTSANGKLVVHISRSKLLYVAVVSQEGALVFQLIWEADEANWERISFSTSRPIARDRVSSSRGGYIH
jgi:hypothetical protein